MNNKVRTITIYLYYAFMLILCGYVIILLGSFIWGEIKTWSSPALPQQTQGSSSAPDDPSTQPNPPSSRQPSSPVWPWLLALAMIIGQVGYAIYGEAFRWPNMFRWLGTLSFAAFALMIALMISNKKATNELAGWEIFEILLTPFVGFISCYLTAHVLETFDKIKENTDRLREAD